MECAGAVVAVAVVGVFGYFLYKRVLSKSVKKGSGGGSGSGGGGGSDGGQVHHK